MGGGDLNTKKSWHPNTMKNQERVWKAEQAAAEEKKKILELQHEREAERDKTHFNEMAKRNFGSGDPQDDSRLHWMYDKPDKQTQQEDYLLGKSIGKSEDQDAQQNSIPAVSRRVVGSSMLTSGDDTQVDLARKMREDPLLLVKERERAARAALLNNPLQRKKIADLLRKEQELKETKLKKKTKKPGKDLDGMLAAKLNALGGDKGIDLSSLLKSDDSSSDSSSDDKSKKKKKKKKDKKSKSKKKKKSKRASSSSGDESDDTGDRKSSNKKIDRHQKKKSETSKDERDRSDKHSRKYEVQEDRSHTSKKRRSDADRDWDIKRKRSKSSESERDSDNYDRSRKRRESRRDETRTIAGPPRHTDTRTTEPSGSRSRYDGERKERKRLTSEEMAAKLAAMAEAGREHEQERGRRVAAQRADEREPGARAARAAPPALPDSLEARIRSNRHYVQRGRLHMNENFARR